MEDQADYAEYRKQLYTRNKQFAKPDWKLTLFKSDKEEEQFRDWVTKNKVPFDPEDPYPDYDLRGFYKALKSGDKRAVSAINPSDKQIHYPDYWKTPYHESFSSESQWANKNAPSWVGDDRKGWRLMDKAGNVYKDETLPVTGK